MHDKPRLKQQAALEYLTTYGWMILIIAVVLVTFIYIGIANPFNTAPRAQTGSCHVLRPAGPYTKLGVALQGSCIGEIPQFVAVFTQSPNPSSLNFTLNTTNLTGFTEAFWLKGNTSGLFPQDVLIVPGITCIFASTPSGMPTSWTYVVMVVNYSNNHGYLYLNNSLVQSSPIIPGNSTTSMIIGGKLTGRSGCGQNAMNGEVANVQVYNNTMSANDMRYLFLQGIGGQPILLNNLVAWWPLNGDSNDYSGDKNNGAGFNLSYTESWTGGYTPP